MNKNNHNFIQNIFFPTLHNTHKCLSMYPWVHASVYSCLHKHTSMLIIYNIPCIHLLLLLLMFLINNGEYVLKLHGSSRQHKVILNYSRKCPYPDRMQNCQHISISLTSHFCEEKHKKRTNNVFGNLLLKKTLLNDRKTCTSRKPYFTMYPVNR